MPLPAVVESLDKVVEGARGFYTEVEGKWVLDADVESHPTVNGLRSTKEKERTDRKRVEAELKVWKDLGATPAEIADLKRRAAEAEHQDKPDQEKVISKRVAEALDKVKPDLEERDRLKAENRRLKLDDRIKAAALKAGMLAEDVDDEMDILLHGRVKRFDLDDHGKPIVLDDDGDSTGKTPEQWFTEVYKTKKPKVFAGTSASGSGARTTTGGAGAMADLENLSPIERLTRARELGIK